MLRDEKHMLVVRQSQQAAPDQGALLKIETCGVIITCLRQCGITYRRAGTAQVAEHQRKGRTSRRDDLHRLAARVAAALAG